MLRFIITLLSASMLVVTSGLARGGSPTAVPEGALSWDRTTADIGQVSEDDGPVECRFVMTNNTDEPVVIVKITTGCGCARPTYPSRPVQPGESAEVTITYNPEGHPGVVDRHCRVYTSLDAENPSALLSIKGKVTLTQDKYYGYPYAIGLLRARQPEVKFRNVPAEGRRVERIETVNSSDRRLTPTFIGLPPYIECRFEPASIEPDAVADLVVAFDRSKYTGKIPIRISVVADGVGMVAPSKRLITIDIE